jgi:hypothetical protein
LKSEARNTKYETNSNHKKEKTETIQCKVVGRYPRRFSSPAASKTGNVAFCLKGDISDSPQLALAMNTARLAGPVDDKCNGGGTAPPATAPPATAPPATAPPATAPPATRHHAHPPPRHA